MMVFGWRLISEKLHRLISKYVVDDDEILFYPVDVKYGRRIMKYYIMHFKNRLKVLNKKESTYVAKRVWKPVLDAKKAPFPKVFTFKDSMGTWFCVAESIKMEMQEQNISGSDYDLVEVR